MAKIKCSTNFNYFHFFLNFTTIFGVVFPLVYADTARSVLTNVTNGDETITRRIYKLFLYLKPVLFGNPPHPVHHLFIYLFFGAFLFVKICKLSECLWMRHGYANQAKISLLGTIFGIRIALRYTTYKTTVK